MKIKQRPFYLISIAVFLGIISPNLLSDGMFMDGLLYAALSNNLAQDIGSFWNLSLAQGLGAFHEHPPLAFGIQSLFFRLFGDNIFIERIYSLSTFIITGYIITRIWNKITNSTYQKLAWLPLLFWVTIPLVTWSASNNMLENTMMIFTCLSILYLLKSFEKRQVFNLILSGLMLSLGVLTKGLVALFPLSFLLWVFVFSDKMKFKQLIFKTTILLFALIMPYVLLFIIIPESYDNLLAYFNRQVIRSIDIIQTVDSRFYIMWRLFKELIPIILSVIIIWLFSKRNKSFSIKSEWSLIFFALGLSGVIPIMISMKQSGFYLLATFPIFSIAFALLIMQNVNFLVEKINTKSKGFRFFNYISFILILVSIALNIFHINKIGRDDDMVKDVYTVIQKVSKKSTISILPEMKNEHTLRNYFYRYGNIRLDPDTIQNYKYILVKKRKKLSTKYKESNLNLNSYNLYENLEMH